MYESDNKLNSVIRGLHQFANWLRRTIYLVLVACMIGFSNAYLDENRMINDIRVKAKQEQVAEDEDTNANL